MPRLIQLVLLLSLTLLTACSVFRPIEKPLDGLVLLAPIKGSTTQILKQKVTLEKYTQTKQFLSVIRFSSEETKLIALLPTGQSFLYLIYDGQHFEEQNKTDIELPSKDILAMLQFTFWPEHEIKQSYLESLGWRVEIMTNKRNLYYKNALLLEVKIEDKNIAITHHADHYNVKINTFDQEVAPL